VETESTNNEQKKKQLNELEMAEVQKMIAEVGLANVLWTQVPNRLELTKQHQYWFKRGVVAASETVENQKKQMFEHVKALRTTLKNEIKSQIPKDDEMNPSEFLSGGLSALETCIGLVDETFKRFKLI